MASTIYSNRHKLLCKLLREAREKQDIYQSDLAKKIGWSQQILAQVEGGHRRIAIVEYIRLTEALGLNPYELIEKVKDAPDD